MNNPQHSSTTMPDAWREWIMQNRALGCTDATLLEAMQTGGVETALAIRWLAQSAENQPHADISVRPYVYSSSRISSGNAIVLPDATVRIASRLHKPDIVVLESLLRADECAALIAYASRELQPSTIVEPGSGSLSTIAERSSEGALFQRGATSLLTTIEHRIAALLQWPVENGEGIQVLHYRPGGEYRPHFDYFAPTDPGSTQHTRTGGQRVATLIMYLNDVEAGGATIFPNLGLEVTPRRGSAVYFSYCNSQGQLDPATLHGGAPVVAGEKWIATKWLRQERYG